MQHVTDTMDFVEQFVRDMLQKSGFGEITEQTEREYIPQLVAEAERRIGLALLPHLDEAGAEEFARIAQSEEPSGQEMFAFMQQHVPNMQQFIQQALEDFSKDFSHFSA